MVKENRLKKINNSGSAMITGVVVTTVLMVLCLSLLAIAYSLFLSSKNNTSDIPERERLYSAAEVFEKELTALNFSVMKTEGQPDTLILNSISGNEPGSNIPPEGEYSSFWTAFMSNVTNDFRNKKFGKEYARYYNMTTVGSYKIVLTTYWTFPAAALTDGAENDIANMEGTILHCDFILYSIDGEIVCKSGKVYRLKGNAGAAGTNSGSNINPVNERTLNLGGNNQIDIWFYASPEDFSNGKILYTLHLMSPKTSLYIKYNDADKCYHIFSKNDGYGSTPVDTVVSLPVVENLDYWYYNLTDGPHNFFFNGEGTEADHNGVHEPELSSTENNYRRQLIAKLLPESGSGESTGTGTGSGSGGSTGSLSGGATGGLSNFWRWEKVTNVSSGSAENT